MFKILWEQVKSYFTKELAEKLVEAFKKALVSFKEALWKEIKAEVYLAARTLVLNIQIYLSSDEIKDKEDALVELIMEKVKLPLVARPFKWLIKRMLKDKIVEVVELVIGKGDELIEKLNIEG